MNGTKQKIQGQAVDEAITKPVGIVKNQEKIIIWNKALTGQETGKFSV